MSKNIIVLSDGTGQIGGSGSNTNVYKLFNMVVDRTDKQIVYYDPGLGTDFKKLAGKVSGRGFLKNLLECYRFIFDNFEAGDQIYLFGFSRGAATVRSLSAFIHYFGILPKSRLDIIDDALKLYQNVKKEDIEERAKAFIEKHHTMWCKIKFLGVWDTVAALGIPNKWISLMLDKFYPHQFHNFELSKSVEFARQALSIDDERSTFHPLIWDQLNYDPQKEKMKQVWFCGVHTDVGGGYKEDDLSNIALKWMMREAVDKGLLIYHKSDIYQKLINSNPDIDGIMHDPQKGIPGRLFKRKTRTWNKNTHGEPCIHESVFNRTKNSSNSTTPKYSPWILNHIDQNNPCIEK